MSKIIGIILILSGLISLFAGIFIDSRYTQDIGVTGNFVLNIIKQPQAEMNLFDYAEAIALSYSAISMIIGFVFLLRV